MRVALKETKGMGMGVYATQAIPAGQVVLKIPLELWYPMSAGCAWTRLNDEEPKLCEDLIEFAKVNSRTNKTRSLLVGSASLIVHLLRELANKEAIATPHLDMIPKTLHVPLFWSDDKLARLQASPIVNKVERRRKLVYELYSQVIGPNAGSAITPPNFAWGWSLILSRAISNMKDQMPFAVVPMLDFFNHASEGEKQSGFCTHWFDHEEKAFMVQTLQAVEADDQLFISYGDLGNSELLRLYGFCLDKNPWNRVRVVPEGVENLTIECNLNGSMSLDRLNNEIDTPTLNSDQIARHLEYALSKYGTTVEADVIELTQIREQKALFKPVQPEATPSTCEFQDIIDHEQALLARIGEKRSIAACLNAV
eukprot:CAMPEP_0203747048 /NCGR_PEP_ID=MMETSP0098-20131031/2299_1 /ASSEMBLY_ACC=CAM_ASM_000208 /TAXON_ID=96639 /ORGANISM=" , Strain NY0313808BC1" /LENGTH=366 /DNA_ID=CAMNT_0050635349 /DNA_START=1224 /DNA_END=2324 /DNA_ORIENTATION=-